MRNSLPGVLLVLMLLVPDLAASKVFFVSPDGDDVNPGTKESPKKTIRLVVNQLGAGDTLYLRGGTYHEEVLIIDLNGTADLPIVIMAYQDETATMDGTVDLEKIKLSGTGWELATDRFPGTTRIYKLQLQTDIWQLFVDERMQVVARWPNASTHPVDPISRVPDSWDAVNGSWWSKQTTWASADAPGTVNGVVENNDLLHDLAATGKSFKGGSVLLSVLEQGGDGNQERLIIDHVAGDGTFSHPVLYPPKPDKAYRKNGKYYIIEHLNALDQPEEWYFIDSTNTIYLWARDDRNPNDLVVRGRNLTRALTLSNSSYVHIRGLIFFASNISVQGDHITVEDCDFNYPDASKRLVGFYPNTSGDACTSFGTIVDGEAFSLINCTFRYSEYSVLVVENGTSSRIDNNLFYHISMLGLGKNGAIEQVNTYTRNTLVTAGNRGAVKTNAGPSSGRDHSFNLFNGFGFLQVPDGAALQANVGNTPGANRAYNWFINAPKYGSRWDGRPAGNGGLNHHQVGVLMRGTLQVKGNEHHTYNNSCFDSPSYNDIILLSDVDYGGNDLSYTFNNLADRMSGNRSENLAAYPLPGTHGNNWNGYEQHRDANLQVRDVVNRDFRPRPGSDLVDAGREIPGFTDGFLGMAPDIGAYEFGDTLYWIPGRKADRASAPVPPDQGVTHYEFVDLMWLEGYRSQSSDIYFGTSEAAVESADQGSTEYMGNQTSNIFNPGALLANQIYYWRIDAVKEGATVKGEVWSFTAGVNANPPVYKATFQVLGLKEGEVFPVDRAVIRMEGRRAWTDEDGNATITMLREGMNNYSIVQKGYAGLIDSVYISSDTILQDTLEHTTYNVNCVLKDGDSGEAIEGGDILFGTQELITDSEGKTALSDIEYAWYALSASATGYKPMGSRMVEIYSDTTLVVTLLKKDHQVQVSVVHRVSEEPVYRAHISYKDHVILTNVEGLATIDHLISGTLVYTVGHNDFFSRTDSLMIQGDTSLVILLTSKLASVQFVISDTSGPVSGAGIELNGYLSLTSDNDGVAKFINQPARLMHGYSISKEGFGTISDSLFLEIDTLVTVMLQPLTGLTDPSLQGFNIYPNPAMDELLISIPFSEAMVRLISMEGKVVLEKDIYAGENMLDLSSLHEGIYCLQIKAMEYNNVTKIIIR